jgi:uncharacterized protein YheU (UPF0270 family)
VLDHAGDLVIGDSTDNLIRVVAHTSGTFYGQAMTAGDIYTIAGTGESGFSGDGGPATAAKINEPAGLVLDGAGNLIFADAGNNRIRVIAASTGTFYEQAMTAGDIYTIAGTGASSFSGDGRPATKAAIWTPDGLAIDGAGNIVMVAADNGRVRVIAHRAGTYYGQAMKAGDIYTVAGNGQTAFSGDGGPAVNASFYYPTGLTIDSAGNLVIADALNDRVRVVATRTGTSYGQAMVAGDIYTIAGNGTWPASGDGGPAASASLHPDSVSFDSAGNLVIADSWNGLIRVVAERTGTYYGQAMTTGDIYTIAGNGLSGASGWGSLATTAQFSYLQSLTVDGSGDMIVTDSGDNLVRMVAARTGTFYGRAMTAGHIYTVAGGGTALGDGGPGIQASLDNPQDATADQAGNLVIADGDHYRVRVVAERTGTYYGQAMTAGDIYTIAGDGVPDFSGDGGPAVSANLNRPQDVEVDNAGNVVIADSKNQRIRVVAERTGTYYGQAMIAGDIYTIAGDGATGSSGDGGPASAATFDFPGRVVIDSAGNVVIADTRSQRIRVVAAQTGSYYGQAMTGGDVYTVAGTGDYGFSGDGGPATSADVDGPEGVAVDSAGNLLIADTGNRRIREVSK